MSDETGAKKIERIKGLLETVAIILAAFFFIYKVFGGWLLVNVAINLDLERNYVPNDSSKDYLAITLNIEKKDTGSVVLDKVRARVTDISGRKLFDIISLSGVEKLEYDQDDKSWILDKTKLNQRLAPGTTTQLSGLVEIPTEIPVLVDVSLVSKPDFGFKIIKKDFGLIKNNQIRATKISLPKSKYDI